MTGHAGRRIAVRVHDGGDPGAYNLVAGLRARRIRLDGDRAPDWRATGDNGWRRLVEGAGRQSVEVSGEGLFAGGPSDQRLLDIYFARSTPLFRLELGQMGVLSGPFSVTRLEIDGPQLAEAGLALTLTSAGPVTFAAG